MEIEERCEEVKCFFFHHLCIIMLQSEALSDPWSQDMASGGSEGHDGEIGVILCQRGERRRRRRRLREGREEDRGGWTAANDLKAAESGETEIP